MKKLIKGTLCDLDKKEIKKKANKLVMIVADPVYYCQKCARVTNDEAYVCKPEKLPNL